MMESAKILKVQIGNNIYQYPPEEVAEGYMFHPKHGIVLPNHLACAEWAKKMIAIEGEKFGISKTKLWEKPDPCYDLDQFMEWPPAEIVLRLAGTMQAEPGGVVK